jgi:hypothetical protein
LREDLFVRGIDEEKSQIVANPFAGGRRTDRSLRPRTANP